MVYVRTGHCTPHRIRPSSLRPTLLQIAVSVLQVRSRLASKRSPPHVPLVDPPSRRNATCAIRQHTSSVCQDTHPRTAPPQTHACTHPEADSLPVELDPAAGGELLLVGCWLLLALRPPQLRSQGLTQAPVQLAWVMTCVVCALMFLPPFPLYRRGGWRRQRGDCR